MNTGRWRYESPKYLTPEEALALIAERQKDTPTLKETMRSFEFVFSAFVRFLAMYGFKRKAFKNEGAKDHLKLIAQMLEPAIVTFRDEDYDVHKVLVPGWTDFIRELTSQFIDKSDYPIDVGIWTSSNRNAPEDHPLHETLLHVEFIVKNKPVADLLGSEFIPLPVESKVIHKRELLTVAKPKPLKAIRDSYIESDKGEPLIVTAREPIWMHKQMYYRARAFKREFGYDFIQWSEKEDDPGAYGFLFRDPEQLDVIIGACAFRWRNYTDSDPMWAMQWIWLMPDARHKGILTKYWPVFTHMFGKFHVERPLSDAMAAFLEKMQHEADPAVKGSIQSH